MDTRTDPKPSQGFIKVDVINSETNSSTRYIAIAAIAQVIIGTDRLAGSLTLVLLTQLADGRSERLTVRGVNAPQLLKHIEEQLLPYQEPPQTETQG